MDIWGYINQQVVDAMRKQDEDLERYLRQCCDMLGLTPEEFSNQYVLEVHPMDIAVQDDGPFLSGDEVKLLVRHSYRIRPKTEKELEAEKHEWQQVTFSFGSWLVCKCGFRPENQEEMDNH